ncbi:MAG: hypothetical protein WBO53_08800 [Thermoanaerobaculia bacterium]
MSNGELDPLDNGELGPLDKGEDLETGALVDVTDDEEGIQVRRGEMKDGKFIKTQIELDPKVYLQMVPFSFRYNKAADKMILAWKRETIDVGGVSTAAANGRCKG